MRTGAMNVLSRHCLIICFYELPQVKTLTFQGGGGGSLMQYLLCGLLHGLLNLILTTTSQERLFVSFFYRRDSRPRKVSRCFLVRGALVLSSLKP